MVEFIHHKMFSIESHWVPHVTFAQTWSLWEGRDPSRLAQSLSRCSIRSSHTILSQSSALLLFCSLFFVLCSFLHHRTARRKVSGATGVCCFSAHCTLSESGAGDSGTGASMLSPYLWTARLGLASHHLPAHPQEQECGALAAAAVLTLCACSAKALPSLLLHT